MSEKMRSALIELGKGILSALIGFLGALAVTSCGSTTKAIIRNGAEATTTTVSISTNNPTNWNVTPDVELNYKPKKD